MALKRKISKTEFDALSDVLKAEYKKIDGKDEYALDTDDAAELSRALDRTKTEKEEAEATARKEKERADKLQKDLDDGATLTNKKKGDIEALETSWKAKEQAAIDAGNQKVEKLRAFVQKTLADNGALALATQISTKPNLLLPHIRSRMVVDFEADEPKLRILGADGKPTAMTPEDLSKEFVANKDYADIMIASKASGSNATGSNSGANGPKKFAEMNDKERTEFYQRDPVGFKAASEADKAAAREGS